MALASGLTAALDALDLSPINVVGIGDAENDHAFLRLCGCSVAVANALDAVKEAADVVTAGARGAPARPAHAVGATGVPLHSRLVVERDGGTHGIECWMIDGLSTPGRVATRAALIPIPVDPTRRRPWCASSSMELPTCHAPEANARTRPIGSSAPA
jgi:haloacid dehalogenase-like hydrolase